jgi:hypothetical protein
MNNTIFGFIEDLNWAAVAVSVFLAFVLGSVWFSPSVFGTYWARQVTRYSGTPEPEITSGVARPASLAPWLVGMAINVIVLALVIEGVRADSAGEGIALGLAVWLGFAATFSTWPPIFARMPWEWWFVNNGAFLVMQVAAGTILALWK